MTYCQSTTQILIIFLVRCIPLSLRLKTRRRATHPTYISSCRSGGPVSCALPFTTNVTISTSMSQTFRSWVAIFHLRQSMSFLSHGSYGMPGFTPPMNVLYLGRRDFYRISSDSDMSGNVWNRSLGSFMVDMGISSNIMKFPSPKCYMTFWNMTIYSDTFNWSNITPICELITELFLITDFDLITKFREVSIEHCNRCGLPTEDAYSPGYLVLSHSGLAFVLMLRQISPEFVMFQDITFRTSLGTSILLGHWNSFPDNNNF